MPSAVPRPEDCRLNLAKELAAEKMATAAVQALDEPRPGSSFYNLIYDSIRGALTSDAQCTIRTAKTATIAGTRTSCVTASPCPETPDNATDDVVRTQLMTTQHHRTSKPFRCMITGIKR